MKTVTWKLLLIAVVAVFALLLVTNPRPVTFNIASAAGNSADAVRIDADPSGNAGSSVGEIQTCREVSAGDTFDVDVVIENVTNILGYDLVFAYDATMLAVVDSDVDFLLGSAPGSDLANQSSPVPDSDGFFGLRALDFTFDPAAAESGTGVLGRVTLQAINSGVSTVFVNIEGISPDLIDFDRDPLDPQDEFGTWVGDMSAARIAIDEECPGGETAPAPTPPVAVVPQIQTPVPGETPEPPDGDVTPGPDETVQPPIQGNTADAIRIDAEPAGNTATSLQPTDFCREVETGDTFDVDIIIEDVSNLFTFAATLSYDESKLRVIDNDIEFLLASDPSSDLVDVSENPPDVDGLFRISAFDRASEATAAENGSGVLARVTLEALDAGTVTLSLAIPGVSPNLIDDEGKPLQPADDLDVWLGDIFDAQIAIDEPCSEPTPAPTDTPAPTNTPTGDSVEDGNDGGGSDLTVVWVIVGVLAGASALAIGFVAWRRLSRRDQL